jgi:hypothetical protein
MSDENLIVPKKQKQVSLWVHPEGIVMGNLFTRTQSNLHAGEEEPAEILNRKEPFVVIKREDPDELRFYNKSSIIRIEYSEDEDVEVKESVHLDCRLIMMDGSVLTGTIIEPMPPNKLRLLDYLNKTDDQFVKLHTEGGQIYLINKSYIIQAISLDKND